MARRRRAACELAVALRQAQHLRVVERLALIEVGIPEKIGIARRS